MKIHQETYGRILLMLLGGLVLPLGPSLALINRVDAGPVPKFVYVANRCDTSSGSCGSVSAYAINGATGALRAVAGSPFADARQPITVTVDPSGRFAYVANFDGSVSAYAINSSTGVLSEIAGSPFAAGLGTYWVAIDPMGRFLYATNWQDESVSAYSINDSTGALRPVAGSPFLTGNEPSSVSVDPSGRFLFVTNYSDGNVSSYVINSSTGALTAAPGSPFDTGQFPSAVTVDPSGRFTYVAIPCAQLDCSSGTVSAYAVNSTTGALREIAGSPFKAGKEVNSLAMDPTGRFLYTANLGDGTISAYSINGSTGALGALAGSPFAAGNATISVALDPSDHFLYMANQCQSAKGCADGCQTAKSCAHGNVSAYTIDSSTGTLTPVPGAPIATGNTSWSVAIASQAQTTSALTLNPHALAFDNTPINTSSAVQTVTVTNTTANTVAITGIGLRGTAPKQFAFTGDCGKSLAGNAVCTIQLNFAPTTVGLKTAFLDVNGGGGGLRSVSLMGKGT